MIHYLTIAFMALSLCTEVYALEDELMLELNRVLEETRGFGEIPRGCLHQECQDHERYCDPRILLAAGMRYGKELAGWGRDDAPLRRILHHHNLTIQGRIIGRSIRTSNGLMEVDLLDRREDLRFQFGANGDPFSIRSVDLGGEGPCSQETLSLVNLQLNRTLVAMNSLRPEQREAWESFCKEYPEYQTRAKEMMNRGWRDDENQPYRGCPPGQGWVRVAAWGLCGSGGHPVYNPGVFERFPNAGLPRAFMYFFDGYGDFNPNRAIYEGAVNLRGDERGEPFTGWSNANGLRLYSRTMAQLERDGFSRFQFELHYQDGSGMNHLVDESRALACHNDMQRWLGQIGPLIPDFRPPQVVVMGYSNGGSAALNFQRGVGRAGHEVDLLITLDPIPRPAGYLLRNVTFSDWLAERHPNTRRHVNIYQDSDYGSMAPLQLRSEALSGADVNMRITPTDWGGEDGRRAHLQMVWGTPRVDERVRCELENIALPEPRLCL